jgi:hypothetical protein
MKLKMALYVAISLYASKERCDANRQCVVQFLKVAKGYC